MQLDLNAGSVYCSLCEPIHGRRWDTDFRFSVQLSSELQCALLMYSESFTLRGHTLSMKEGGPEGFTNFSKKIS